MRALVLALLMLPVAASASCEVGFVNAHGVYHIAVSRKLTVEDFQPVARTFLGANDVLAEKFEALCGETSTLRRWLEQSCRGESMVRGLWGSRDGGGFYSVSSSRGLSVTRNGTLLEFQSELARTIERHCK